MRNNQFQLPLAEKILEKERKWMRNQPKYHFFKNTAYALSGLRDLIENETSFRLEIFFVFLLLPVIFIVETEISIKLILFITLMGMPLAEAINSAIERTVDLVTLEYNENAKKAKDAGSAIVFLSIFIFVATWVFVFLSVFFVVT